ncbi:unnamed protein product, partial [Mycena citricolor]
LPSTPRMSGYLTGLPTELLLLISRDLSDGSLGSLAISCRGLNLVLQSDLDARLTPTVAKEILLPACASGKFNTVLKVISPPYNVSATLPVILPSGRVNTPLQEAVTHCHRDVAEILLSHGADPNYRCEYYQNEPLAFLAAYNQDWDTMHLLLDHGVDINAEYFFNGLPETLIHSACNVGDLEKAQIFVACGANIEQQGIYGDALCHAVKGRHPAVVAFLLGAGANPNARANLVTGWLPATPPGPTTGPVLLLALDLAIPGNLWDCQSEFDYPWRGVSFTPWRGMPLDPAQRDVIALLLAFGAETDSTWTVIRNHLHVLAESAGQRDEDMYVKEIEDMLHEAQKVSSHVREQYAL